MFTFVNQVSGAFHPWRSDLKQMAAGKKKTCLQKCVICKTVCSNVDNYPDVRVKMTPLIPIVFMNP